MRIVVQKEVHTLSIAFFLALALTLYQVQISFAKTVLTVGVYNNAPSIFVDSDGNAKGLFIDILEFIAEKEDWEIEYQSGHFAELLDGLKNNKIDLLPAVAFSRDRESFIDYTFETVMSNWAELYVNNTQNINSMLDLEDKIVAVKEGDIHFLALKKMANNFNINVRFFETDEYTTVLEMLQNDYVDVAVVNRLFGNRNMDNFGVRATQVIFNPIEMRYAVPKGKNIAILGAIDAHLTRFKTDTQSIYYSAINRWFVIDTRASIPTWLFHALYTVLVLALLLLMTVFLFRQQVRKRTRQLEISNQHLTAEIKERANAEEKLQKFVRVVEASSDAMALIDRRNLHVLANHTYLEITGFTGESVAGIPLGELIGERFFTIELEDAVSECLQGKVTHVQTRPRKEHSNPKYWNVTLSPYFLESGELDGYVIDIRDVTDELELQNRLKNAQKMEAIGMLAGGVAHDLNNILSGLVSYPDMLLVNRADDDPMTKPLQTIKKSGERAAAIVQDLLTLARRGIGQSEPQNLNIIVHDFLVSPEHDDILRNFDGIEVSLDLEEELKNMKGSAPHLSKLLMNLFTNSLEAMAGGGKLLISTHNAAYQQEYGGYEVIPPGDYVVLSVADTGIGMSKTELNRVFEPFYTKKVMGRSGTGLGMAVVWGSIKDHHGYVDIKSKVGTGTTFMIYVPSTTEEVPLTEPSLHQFPGNGETVLIVDDLQSQRSLASTIITKLGYSGETAESGEEAIKRCLDKNYDLLILDMIMPDGIDGLTTYEKIKKINPEQRAVIASGFSESSRVKQAQDIGAGAYIRKPYTVESLAKAIYLELNN